jgi:hypothetical protein
VLRQLLKAGTDYRAHMDAIKYVRSSRSKGLIQRRLGRTKPLFWQRARYREGLDRLSRIANQCRSEDPVVFNPLLLFHSEYPAVLISLQNWKAEFHKWIGRDRIGVMTGDQEKARIKQFIYAYVNFQPCWSIYSSFSQEAFPGAYHWL